MARAGMSNIIRRVRGMAQLGTADYSLVIGDGSTVFWWTDDQIQEMCDAIRVDYQFLGLTPSPEFIAGTNVYKNYYAGPGHWEEATSGSAFWLIVDNAGTNPGTANYTVDYIAGLVRFNADRGGTSYFLTGRTFNLNAAAADIWRQKAAAAAGAYDFKTDNQEFKRSQFAANCLKMAAFFDKQGGIRVHQMVRKDLLEGGTW